MKIKKHYLKIIGSSLLIVTPLIGITSTLSSCGKSNDSWTEFLSRAQKESASNLLSQIKSADLVTKYHWKANDKAVFSATGTPKQKDQNQEVVASIVIQGAPTNWNYPINFDIKYHNDDYKISNWSISQTPYSQSWITFKTDALKESPTSLLATAKINKSNWDSLKWLGSDGSNQSLVQNHWTDSETAQWDVYGGNGGDDPYKGMAGTIVANDSDHSISAIFSIVGKSGLWDANPIKAIISDSAHIPYDPANWKFSAITQLQSWTKYLSLYNVELAHAKTWANFDSVNWVDNNHTSNINDYLNLNGLPGDKTVTFEKSTPKIMNTTKTAYQSNLEFLVQRTESSHATLDLTATFAFADVNDTTIGNAFNNIWNAKLT